MLLEPCRTTPIHHMEKNHLLFARNNIIIDAVERLTYNPYEDVDGENDSNVILKNNKEIAMIYCIIILGSILYIVLSDWLDPNK